MRISTLAFVILALGLPLLASLPVQADTPEQHLTIKNKLFDPAELTVPAGQKIKLFIKNNDAEASEFESLELNREKVVPANDQVTVYIGPLDPGTYPFFNDFDPQKSKGKIIAK